ncbi:MAG: hypothetical protein JWM16_2679 [Verrucomicrobiales bacterium]|nr:hypothetical protein [Verrucomicrobiales bacterium]
MAVADQSPVLGTKVSAYPLQAVPASQPLVSLGFLRFNPSQEPSQRVPADHDDIGFYPRRSAEVVPDVRVIRIEHNADAIGFGAVSGGHELFAGNNGAILEDDGCACAALIFGMSMAGKGTGPSNVAMAGRVQRLAGFAEDPACAGVFFAQGEEIRRNILVTARDALLGGGK